MNPKRFEFVEQLAALVFVEVSGRGFAAADARYGRAISFLVEREPLFGEMDLREFASPATAFLSLIICGVFHATSAARS